MRASWHIPVRKRDRWIVSVFVAAVVVAVSVLGYVGMRTNLQVKGQLIGPSSLREPTADPFSTRPLYVNPNTLTARAAAKDPRLTPLARTPQAAWFGGSDDPAQAAAELGTYVANAVTAHALPVVVLYNIPDRDCGGYAQGGATSEVAYLTWIEAMANALRGTTTVVMLEPDSIANSAQCGGQKRLRLLAAATERLAAAGAQVYLDGGHSDWISAHEMAERLKTAGIDRARGFVTNVANYRSTQAELRYARSVSSALAGLGVGSVHYVIDTGRNGGTITGGDWCNPRRARLGAAPNLSFDGALDGYLWIKPPAESDGTCHGGPLSGLWKTMALTLMGIDDED